VIVADGRLFILLVTFIPIMPKFYLNIMLNEASADIENDLGQIVNIGGKIEWINLYMANVDIAADTPEKVSEAYKNLVQKLIDKRYVKKVETSAELTILNA
jgi:hypothetical protein